MENELLKEISLKLNKLEGIEERLNKLEGIENEVKSINKSIQGIQKDSLSVMTYLASRDMQFQVPSLMHLI